MHYENINLSLTKLKLTAENAEKAQALPDDVPIKEKEKRHKILLDYQRSLWSNRKDDKL